MGFGMKRSVHSVTQTASEEFPRQSGLRPLPKWQYIVCLVLTWILVLVAALFVISSFAIPAMFIVSIPTCLVTWFCFRVTAVAKKRANLSDVEMKNYESTQHARTMTGTIEYRVFVYDARPLRGIPVNTKFNAEIIRQRVTLTSTLTGTEYDTADGGYALARFGQVFGTLPNEELCRYLDQHNSDYIECIWHEWYDKAHGFPSIVALAPGMRNRART